MSNRLEPSAWPYSHADLESARSAVTECQRQLRLQRRLLNKLSLRKQRTAEAYEALRQMRDVLEEARQRLKEIEASVKPKDEVATIIPPDE